MPLGSFRLNGLSKYFPSSISFDRPIQVTAVGSSQVVTDQVRFGTGSLRQFGNPSGLVASMLPPQGDFTIEYWYRGVNRSAQSGHWQFRNGDHRIEVRTGTGVGGQLIILITDENGNTLWSQTSGGGVLPDNQWRHVATTRQGNTFRLFSNGSLIISNTVPFNIPQTTSLQIAGFDGGFFARAYIDEFRISNFARYTSNFTIPSTAFTNDANTLLLLHMDGPSGSTVFLDDNS
jgi:hypothetical protein